MLKAEAMKGDMKNRIKKCGPVVRTRGEMETLVGEIARLKNEEQTLSAEMDGRIQEVRTDYESRLAAIADEINLRMASAEEWSLAHPDEFGKAKSVDMTHAVVGWRTGQPQLKTLAGFTWDRVLERLRSLAQYAGFIRTKQEVDKQGIIAARENLLDADFRQMGVRVVQDESFYVDPKVTEVETTVSKEAA
jgi:phage host-nuclease inhibitor protein Gam